MSIKEKMKKVPGWVYLIVGILIGVTISWCAITIINKSEESQNADSNSVSSNTSSIASSSSQENNSSVSENTSSQTADNTIKEWDSAATYNSGDEVMYNGKRYRAKWWTLNEVPEVKTDGVWEEIQ